MGSESEKKAPDSGKRLTRREVLKKYGPYTAPVVVSMLMTSHAYAMFMMTTYATLSACVQAHGGMANHGAMRHPIG